MTTVRSCARPRALALSHLPCAIAGVLSISLPLAAAAAPAIEFSEGFLIGGQSIDMRRYAQGNPIEEGQHRVDVWINGQFHQTRDITFKASEGEAHARPCLPADLLDALQLREDHRQALHAQVADIGCIDLPTAIEGATANFDDSALQLQLTVPQAMQARRARGRRRAAARAL